MALRVQQGKDGIWYTRIYQGTDHVTGKKLRKYRRFPEASSEDEALEMARGWVASLPGGGSESMRLSYVLGLYVKALPGMGRAENTCKTYGDLLSRYVAPYIGGVDADELRSRDVESLYAELHSRGLSPSTVDLVHRFLRGAYKWVVKEGFSPVNPMTAVSRKRAPQREALALTPAELVELGGRLVAIASGDEVPPEDGKTDPVFARMAAAACLTALWTGMRRGECLALRLCDLHREAGSLHVSGTVNEPVGSAPRRQDYPKGKRSRNVSVSDGFLALAEGHVRWRITVLGSARAGNASLPLFCTASGGYLRPSKLTTWFRRLARSMGLRDGVCFHTLRHTHATCLIGDGVDVRTVQERLGHAEVTTTLRTYAHLLPGRDRDAAGAMDGLMGS